MHGRPLMSFSDSVLNASVSSVQGDMTTHTSGSSAQCQAQFAQPWLTLILPCRCLSSLLRILGEVTLKGQAPPRSAENWDPSGILLEEKTIEKGLSSSQYFPKPAVAYPLDLA